MNEKTLRYLEKSIPELAEGAVTQAYWQALAAGHSVLKTENGMLIEVQPDGTKRMIKARASYTSKERPKVKNQMIQKISRLRIFSEPNGSGKSNKTLSFFQNSSLLKNS